MCVIAEKHRQGIVLHCKQDFFRITKTKVKFYIKQIYHTYLSDSVAASSAEVSSLTEIASLFINLAIVSFCSDDGLA